MTTTTATFSYHYGESVTEVTVPLPNTYRYTKGQQDLIDFAEDHGWTLDVTALYTTYGGYRFDGLTEERRRANLAQHPFVFVRPGTDGGTWRVELDYVSREFSYYGGKSFTKTLKGARLTFTGDDGAVNTFDAALSGYATLTGSRENTEIVLAQQSTASYAATNWVWHAALVGEGYSTRERVQALLVDPEGVVFRAVTAMAADKADQAAYEAERERIRALKARPLPAGWEALQEAAQAVVKADGMSDTDALLAALTAALAAVEG